MINRSIIQRRLRRLNIRPQKKWGQNFLINPGVSHQIASAVLELEPKKIVEVGPGLGSLTELLLSAGVPFQVVERDPALCEFWRKRGLDVIQKDALLLDKELDSPCTAAGNLPYQISSSFILSASIKWSFIENMVLAVQKETADRILSEHQKKEFGMLSVMVQCVWSCRLLTQIQAVDFYPKPQVDGAVLLFKRKKELDVDLCGFMRFLKVCFAHKRKLLKGKIEQAFTPSAGFIFSKMALADSIRAEELSPLEYLRLFQYIQLKT